jgi:hypothetical protein
MKNIQKTILSAVVPLAIGMVVTQPANAIVLTYDYEGTVSSTLFSDLSGQLAGAGIAAGTSITGSFSYDTDTPDSQGLSTIGLYQPVSIDGTFVGTGVNVQSANPATRILVKNNLSGNDQFDLIGEGATSNTLTYDGGLSLRFRLLDNTETALDNDSLPASLSLGDFASIFYQMEGRTLGLGFDKARVNINTLTQVAGGTPPDPGPGPGPSPTPNTADIDAMNAILQSGEFVNAAGEHIVIPFETVGGTNTIKVLTVGNGGKLTNNGTVENDGVMNVINNGLIENNDTLDNDRSINLGSGSKFQNNTGANVENDGVVLVRRDSLFTNDGSFVNNDRLVIEDGGVLDGGGTITQNTVNQFNPATLIVNGTVTNTLIINSGTLSGDGTINGSVTLGTDAEFVPGNSPGILDIVGDLNVAAGAVIQLEVGDKINVSGNLVLAQGVIIELVFGDFPPSSDPIDLSTFFDIGGTSTVGSDTGVIDLSSIDISAFFVGGGDVNAGPVFVSFGQNDPLQVPTGESGDATPVDVNDSLEVSVPEPGTLALFSIGLAGLGALRRRRKMA